jgi:AbrB family looped-hinge helix DNA binding protein
MPMAKVTAKFQITIPPEVRTELGILPGCEVDICKERERLVLVVDPIAELKNKWQGKLKDKQKSDAYMNQTRCKAS